MENKKAKRVDSIFRHTSHFVVRETKMIVYNAEVRRKVKISSVLVFSFCFVTVITLSSIPSWSSIGNAETSPVPDFSSAKIRDLRAVDSEVAFKVEKDGGCEVWLYGNTQKNISVDSSVSCDFPVGVKDKYTFWVSSDRKSLFVYDSSSDKRTQQSVPRFNSEKGEKGSVKIWSFPWEIRVGSDQIFFNSKETGEVFSDDNSEVLETFRYRYSLDTLLDKEELETLGFQVEENE